MTQRRLLGVVEVDSGTLLVGDPCYVLPRRATGSPGVDYEAVLRSDPRAVVAPLGDRPVLLLSGFSGDGTYPVMGEFEQGELVRICVEFVGPDDEDP